MLIKGKFLYLRVVTPEVKWIRFIMPIFIFTEIIECLLDLLALGAIIAPKAKVNKNGLEIRNIRSIIKGMETFLVNLHNAANEDLVNVSVGAEKIKVIIKVI